jgi:hypothetical protein
MFIQEVYLNKTQNLNKALKFAVFYEVELRLDLTQIQPKFIVILFFLFLWDHYIIWLLFNEMKMSLLFIRFKKLILN